MTLPDICDRTGRDDGTAGAAALTLGERLARIGADLPPKKKKFYSFSVLPLKGLNKVKIGFDRLALLAVLDRRYQHVVFSLKPIYHSRRL